MKKIFLILFITLIASPLIVSASETAYYTNLNGAVLTKEEYNNLNKVFDKNTIATMTVDMINKLKDETKWTTVEETKYIRVDDYFDSEGNLIKSEETEVTEDEALNFKDYGINPMDYYTSYQTSMKKLTMQIRSTQAELRVVTLTNTWLSIPSVKSYDVIALRPASASYTINLYSNSISGYQSSDGNITNYTASSSNVKNTGSFTGNGGIGISMNIVDSTSSSLENSMTVIFVAKGDPFKIYGTYQHATSTVTLAESQNYTFSANGYGEVLNFASSVKSKYDDMKGVYLSYNYADELYG